MKNKIEKIIASQSLNNIFTYIKSYFYLIYLDFFQMVMYSPGIKATNLYTPTGYIYFYLI